MISTGPSILTMRSTKIELTQDQKDALLKIVEFKKSKDQFFLLSGYAGTGKTTIAENISAYLRANVMAPTNAAVKRLREKIPTKGVDFSTLHQMLYGGPDPETGEFQLARGLEYKKTYIVDECSMIDEQVLLDLITSAKKSKSKIIFMGDNFQLEPVGKDPKIFAWEKNNPNFKAEWKHTLTEVKRNDGAILKAATHLRNCQNPILLDQQDPTLGIYTKFSPDLIQNVLANDSYIVLTSTNKKRLEYNRLIRDLRMKELPEKSEVIDTEKVISIANTFFSNGEQYTILQPRIEDVFVKEVNVGSKNYPEWKYYKFALVRHLIETSDPLLKERQFTTLLVVDLDKASLHPSMLMSNNFFKYSDTYTVEVEYANGKRYRQWNPNVIISVYGYATSTHKAQGQEWDNVYINADWLSDQWDNARWLYTALTRAKKKVEIKKSNYFRVAIDG
jgi:energy-coupling factor transporter ATP-binding protein EcfA2